MEDAGRSLTYLQIPGKHRVRRCKPIQSTTEIFRHHARIRGVLTFNTGSYSLARHIPHHLAGDIDRVVGTIFIRRFRGRRDSDATFV